MGVGSSQIETPVVINDEPDPYLKDVKIHLRDINSHMTEWWNEVWLNSPETFLEDAKFVDLVKSNTQVSKGDIFQSNEGLVQADAIVSPANSFGFMDGGIDLAYSEHFGWQMMARLQDEIKSEEYNGELLVGQAIIITTKDPKNAIKYLISAPTMRVPADVRNTVNAYLAFRATLMAGTLTSVSNPYLVVRKHNKMVLNRQIEGTFIKSILCPGLGTAVGRMSFRTCAIQMLKAYENVVLGRIFPHTSLAGYQHEHHDLKQDLDDGTRQNKPTPARQQKTDSPDIDKPLAKESSEQSEPKPQDNDHTEPQQIPSTEKESQS